MGEKGERMEVVCETGGEGVIFHTTCKENKAKTVNFVPLLIVVSFV